MCSKTCRNINVSSLQLLKPNISFLDIIFIIKTMLAFTMWGILSLTTEWKADIQAVELHHWNPDSQTGKVFTGTNSILICTSWISAHYELVIISSIFFSKNLQVFSFMDDRPCEKSNRSTGVLWKKRMKTKQVETLLQRNGMGQFTVANLPQPSHGHLIAANSWPSVAILPWPTLHGTIPRRITQCNKYYPLFLWHHFHWQK